LYYYYSGVPSGELVRRIAGFFLTLTSSIDMVIQLYPELSPNRKKRVRARLDGYRNGVRMVKPVTSYERTPELVEAICYRFCEGLLDKIYSKQKLFCSVVDNFALYQSDEEIFKATIIPHERTSLLRIDEPELVQMEQLGLKLSSEPPPNW